MSRTQSFRTQHQEIGDILKQVEAVLTPATVAAKGDEVRKTLVALTGKITIHLAMEDKSLYPTMVASANADAKKMAQDYMTEMGGLADAYKAYVGKWGNGQIISAQAETFCTETKGIIDALRKRIQREETQLYPLADSI